MREWREPWMQELSPEDLTREEELYKKSTQYQLDLLADAVEEFGRALAEFVEKAAAALRRAAAPLVYVASEYAENQKKRMQQYEISQGRAIGMRRQVHLAANAQKYRTRKKNLNRIKKALEKGDIHE